MSVTVPYNTRKWARTRILVASDWGKPWIKLPMVSQARNGFRLRRYTRTCLPDEGTAIFRLPYGKIDARQYIDGTFGSELGAPDLHGYEVRIQGQLTTGQWKTIWWGQCVAMRDSSFPGSDVPAGDMDYHCVDGLARTRRWYLDYHQSWFEGAAYRGKGHPGYNEILGRGDREATGYDGLSLGFAAHTWPTADEGDGDAWTDQDAMEHAIASSVPGLFDAGTTASAIADQRAKFPTFTLYGQVEWLQGINVWKSQELLPLRRFMEMMFDRARGRGLAFCDWEDDTDDDPTHDLVPRITIRPEVIDDVVVTLPSGGTETYPGSDTADTTIDVDVIGDHRLGEDAQRTFQITAISDIEHDGVEVRGEYLNVMAVLSKKDSSLAGRWLAGEQTDLVNATPRERELNEAKFDHVFRRYGIPKDWDLMCGDGTGHNRTRVDFRCDDHGTILVPSNGQDLDTSPLLISIAERLPMYFGYDYTVDPVVTFHGNPPGDLDQVPPHVWVRVAEDSSTGAEDSPHTDRYINAGHTMGITLARHAQDLQIRCAEDNGGRYRKIGDKTISGLSSRYNDDQMVLLVALQLPHRLRMLNGVDGDKTKRITLRDHHLWLGHPGCIVALDQATTSNGGYGPKRIHVSSGEAVDVAVLRDDRDRIARVLAMASTWYLPRRKTATWTLSDGGFSDGWLPADADGLEDTTASPISWPRLGELVDTMTYSGRDETLQTPITREDYDEDTGAFTWATSWSDRDWR